MRCFFYIVLIITSLKCSSKIAPSIFNIQLAQKIEQNFLEIRSTENVEAANIYLDSVLIEKGNNKDYKLFIKILGAFNNIKTDIENSYSTLEQILLSPDFGELHYFLKYHTHIAFSKALIETKEYYRALNETFKGISQLDGKELDHQRELSISYGDVHYISAHYLEEYQTSITAIQNSIEIAKSEKDYKILHRNYYNLSVLFVFNKSYEKALEFALKAKEINENYLNDINFAIQSHTLALIEIYSKLDRKEELLQLYNNTISTYQHQVLEDAFYSFELESIMPLIRIGELTQAENLIKKYELIIPNTCSNRYRINLLHTGRAELYRLKQQYDKERLTLRKSLEIMSCAKTNSYFSKEKKRNLLRLVEIDSILNGGAHNWIKFYDELLDIERKKIYCLFKTDGILE